MSGELSGYRIDLLLKKLERKRAARKAAKTKRRNKQMEENHTIGYMECNNCSRTILKNSSEGLCGHCWSAKHSQK